MGTRGGGSGWKRHAAHRKTAALCFAGGVWGRALKHRIPARGTAPNGNRRREGAGVPCRVGTGAGPCGRGNRQPLCGRPRSASLPPERGPVWAAEAEPRLRPRRRTGPGTWRPAPRVHGPRAAAGRLLQRARGEKFRLRAPLSPWQPLAASTGVGLHPSKALPAEAGGRPPLRSPARGRRDRPLGLFPRVSQRQKAAVGSRVQDNKKRTGWGRGHGWPTEVSRQLFPSPSPR